MSDRHTRGEFMGLTAAGVAGVLTPPWLGDGSVAGAAPRTPMTHTSRSSQLAEPDLVVFNAKVYTMDSAAPRAEAFAAIGG